MNKSLATNLITVGLISVGYISPVYSDQIFTVGLFATSGAITNWLAVHMLFEKVPGLYGSGVIPNRFEEFKANINKLIMEQFFTRENVGSFFAFQSRVHGRSFNVDPILEAIDFDQIYSGFVNAVLSSPFGGILRIFGGATVLSPLKNFFKNNMKEEARNIFCSQAFIEAIQSSVFGSDLSEEIIGKVECLVIQRLNELTPDMVKKIVQDMIHQHLGWLVIWGGVFGGFIGLITGFMR